MHIILLVFFLQWIISLYVLIRIVSETERLSLSQSGKIMVDNIPLFHLSCSQFSNVNSLGIIKLGIHVHIYGDA